MSTHECRGCNVHYDVDAWRALPFVETLGPAEARDVFTEWPWPRDAMLEVRRCTCGQTITSLSSDKASAERGASHAA
jgi:hypothetical protein